VTLDDEGEFLIRQDGDLLAMNRDEAEALFMVLGGLLSRRIATTARKVSTLEKRTKAPVYTTPAGEFVWPWLNKADDRPIKGKPQTPAYKLNLRYPANAPAWLALKEKIDELVEASFDKAVAENPKKKKLIVRAYPYSMDTDDDGEETGYVTFKLKQNASFKDKRTGEVRAANVALFDASFAPSTVPR
jgi:hypothetical protein